MACLVALKYQLWVRQQEMYRHCINGQVDYGVPLVDNNDLRQHRDLGLALDEWLEMAREVPLQARPVVGLVGGECRTNRIAVGRKDRAEPNVQDLARVEV